MFFTNLLDVMGHDVADLLPLEMTREQHREILDQVLPQLGYDANLLLGMAKVLFGETAFDRFEKGFTYRTVSASKSDTIQLPISIGSWSIQPSKEDESIALRFDALRSYKERIWTRPVSVEMGLEIQSPYARMVFEPLYQDYRAYIIRLIENAKLEFFTPYCPNIAEKTKARKISVKLDEYFADPNAGESIHLLFSCFKDTENSATIRAFLVLSLLYLACCSAQNNKSWRHAFEKNLTKIM